MTQLKLPVALTVLAEYLGIGQGTAYRWAKKNIIPTYQGMCLMVEGKLAWQIMRDWNRSCTQMEAARFLGVSPSNIWDMVEAGILQTIKPFPKGKKRVLVDSLINALFLARRVKPEDVLYPDRTGFARLTPQKAAQISHRWDSREACAAQKKRRSKKNKR
jgi:predicted DNA-binding transcriptional regulator AlpA